MASLGLDQKHEVIAETSRCSVADAFLAFKLRFVIYDEYCSRLDKGREHVMKLMKEDSLFCRKLNVSFPNVDYFKAWSGNGVVKFG